VSAEILTSIGNSLGRNCGPCLINGARLSATIRNLAATTPDGSTGQFDLGSLSRKTDWKKDYLPLRPTTTAPYLTSLDGHTVGRTGPLTRIDKAKLLSRNVSLRQFYSLGLFLDVAALAVAQEVHLALADPVELAEPARDAAAQAAAEGFEHGDPIDTTETVGRHLVRKAVLALQAGTIVAQHVAVDVAAAHVEQHGAIIYDIGRSQPRDADTLLPLAVDVVRLRLSGLEVVLERSAGQ